MSSLNNETGESYRERKWEKQNLYKMDNIKLIELYPHHIYELDSYLHEQIKSYTENKNSNWLVKNMFPKNKKKNEKQVTKKPFIDNVPLSDKSSKSSICNFCNFSNTGNTNYCEECGNKIQS